VIIRFLHLRGTKHIEINQQLSKTCSDGVMDVKNVRSCVRQFKEGRTSCENKPKEPRPRTSRSEDMIAHDFRIFRSSRKMVSTDPTDMPALAAILYHSQAAIFNNDWFRSRNNVSRSASAWPRLLGFFFTRRSSFFELSYPRTQICHFHNAIIACLTQLLMNFDGFYATRVEESDNHALFFECKRRHFQYLKHYWHSKTSQAFNG